MLETVPTTVPPGQPERGPHQEGEREPEQHAREGAVRASAGGDPIQRARPSHRPVRAHGSLRTDQAGDLTLRNLPSGTYQFWPYASDSEAESILASEAPPPITVNVKPGENAVVVEFRAK